MWIIKKNNQHTKLSVVLAISIITLNSLRKFVSAIIVVRVSTKLSVFLHASYFVRHTYFKKWQFHIYRKWFHFKCWRCENPSRKHLQLSFCQSGRTKSVQTLGTGRFGVLERRRAWGRGAEGRVGVEVVFCEFGGFHMNLQCVTIPCYFQ